MSEYLAKGEIRLSAGDQIGAKRSLHRSGRHRKNGASARGVGASAGKGLVGEKISARCMPLSDLSKGVWLASCRSPPDEKAG